MIARDTLLALTPDLRALADIRLMRLEDGPGEGQRMLLARNAIGIAFEIAVDRAFDVSALSYEGVEIGWHSQNQMRYPAVPPQSDNGHGFLRSFDGLLVTCGLNFYGAPKDASADETFKPRATPLAQHGELHAHKARLVGYGIDEDVIWAEGIVRQAGLGTHVLELRRRITLGLFGNTLSIQDRVTNRGFTPAPHALLYHVNYGWPMLDECTELSGGIGAFAETFKDVPPIPAPGAEEYCEHLWPEADADGQVRVSLSNPKLGLKVGMAWPKAALPFMLIWRNYASGDFALGLEPGTPLPAFENGKMKIDYLPPQAEKSYALRLTLENIMETE